MPAQMCLLLWSGRTTDDSGSPSGRTACENSKPGIDLLEFRNCHRTDIRIHRALKRLLCFDHVFVFPSPILSKADGGAVCAFRRSEVPHLAGANRTPIHRKNAELAQL